MLKTTVLIVVALAGLAGQSSAPQATVDSLSWMSGTWGATIGGVVMEEHWTAAKSGALIGMHSDVVKGKTVSFEFLRIEEQDGKLVYLAMPKGRSPATPFTMVEQSATRVVFENLAHDYPQRIIYWKDGADLRARTEGPQNGKTVGEEWRWLPLLK